MEILLKSTADETVLITFELIFLKIISVRQTLFINTITAYVKVLTVAHMDLSILQAIFTFIDIWFQIVLKTLLYFTTQAQV